jgi:hypothetical protein
MVPFDHSEGSMASTISATAPEAPQPERVARYAARLDAELSTFTTDAARAKFLSAERVKWIARYERFCARIDAGGEPDWGETASDYLLTVAEITGRLAHYERECAA